MWCFEEVWALEQLLVDTWLLSSERRWRSDLSSDHSSSELLTATVTTLWHPSGICTFLLFVLFSIKRVQSEASPKAGSYWVIWGGSLHPYTGKWGSAQSLRAGWVLMSEGWNDASRHTLFTWIGTITFVDTVLLLNSSVLIQTSYAPRSIAKTHRTWRKTLKR